MKKLNTPIGFIMVIVLSLSLAFCAAAYQTGRAAFLPGDTTCDGKVTTADARLTLRHAVSLEKLTGDALKAADADENGTIDTADARNILRYSVGIDLDLKGTPAYVPPETTKAPEEYRIAMLGDSQVATAANYNIRSSQFDYFGRVSLNVYTIFNKKAPGSDRYIIDEVKDRDYDAIIIHLGVNEISYSNSTWGEQYGKVIDALKERAPDAEIYCSAILPITESASKKNEFGCNNKSIIEKNEIIRSVAAQKGVHFIDAGTILRNDQGVLPSNAAPSDGVHLGIDYAETWINWTFAQITG